MAGLEKSFEIKRNSIEKICARAKAAAVVRRIAEEKARQEKIAELEKEKASLQAELPNLKGMFSGSKKKKMESRIAAIDAELAKLNK